MNVLVTSFSLLLVLALGSSLFWKEALSSSFSFRAIKGMYDAKREARNSLEKKAFARLKDTKQSSKKEKGRKTRDTTFCSHRLEIPPREQARLGIMAIRDLDQQVTLKPIAQRLLIELYGHTPWFDTKIVQNLVDALASASKNFDQESFVAKLDIAEYKMWYLMSKGTQTYDLISKKGYPPLTDFIDFHTRSLKHTCHFPFASFPLLQAMFGEEIANEIIAIEKTKWNENHRRRCCLKKELLALIQTKRQSAELTQIVETYCYFSQSIGKRSFVQGEDKRSGITVRREVVL